MFWLLSDINHGWLYYTLMSAYIITVIGIVVVVLSENRSPVKSLAWVTVLLLLPAVGVVLYLFFGRSIKNTRMISRRNRRKLRRHEEQARRIKIGNLALTPQSKQLIRLTRTLSGSTFNEADDIEVYVNGREKFGRLIRDINEARHYINLQYYIIEDDSIGTAIQEALMAKARGGVKVRIIYDNVGSFKARRSFFRAMEAAGIEVYPFFKVVFPPFGTRINWRNHRKICVIDGRIGYIGGMNVADRYISGGKFASWRDTHIRLTGAAVSALQYSFAVDWNFMGHALIQDSIPASAARVSSERSNPPTVTQLLTSGPTSQWTNIMILYMRAITSAHKRVFIQTPYFLPTEGLLKALQAAALSGVDVRIMIPARSDSWMLDHASASYVDESLKSGIKIYLYEAGMLHAKTMLVDDEMVSIGSTNFDFRSFEHNFEANMQIYSRSFNHQMAAIFMDDLKSCSRISAAQWHKRPLTKKLIESVVRLFSPIL